MIAGDRTRVPRRMTAISDFAATDLLRHYRQKTLSPVEVMRDILARIERFEPKINAFVLVDAEGALAAARESEARWIKGTPVGAVDGLPVTVKDNLWLAGFPTRKGSAVTDTEPAPEDAPAVARLREQGAVFIGKTTMPEFGWIGACHSPLTGITRNPWRLDRTTGGSSGGAAAAAALNLGVIHLGTDGAGSIRIPAAFSGVVGIKAHYGRVPSYPASAFTALAHTGPLTRTVTDAALALSIIAAPDPRDMTAPNTPAPDYGKKLDLGVHGLRVAFSPRLGFVAGLDPEVEQAVRAAAQVFADLGASVEEADPPLAAAPDIIRTVWGAVSATIVDAVPPAAQAQMDPGFRAVAERGRAVSLAAYLETYPARNALAIAMAAFHDRYDLLLTPQMPIPALEAGRVTPADGRFGDDWLNWSPYTYPFNLTQQPAASVPCGFTAGGLPIGLQIVAPARRDDLVLRAARAYEAARPFVLLTAPRTAPDSVQP